MDGPWNLSALEQAGLVRSREIGAEELLDLHLARIAEADPKLNAFVERLFGRAQRHARRIDRQRSSWPDPLPSFFGVPFAIKDNDPMRFAFTRVGSRALRWAWTPWDSAAVKLLRAAGFVMLGKTTTSEFALMPVVESDLHPPTRNPWNTEHSAGGSSGGAAAAVSSGMLPIAHAADGGGSIRIPASFCHLFGFKASRGLTADFYGRFDVVGLSVGGAVTRTVADSAALMDALCGRPTMGAAESLERLSAEPAPRGLDVRVCLDSPLTQVDDQIATAVQRVARALESAGHKVSSGPRLDGSIDDFLPIFGRLAANVPILGEGSIQPVTRWLREIGRQIDKARAIEMNEQLGARVLEWFSEADLVITPTVARTAPKVGEFDDPDPETSFRKAAQIGSFTAPFNISGQPAASIPVAISTEGLPIGVQIVGRRGADALVLAVARELERDLEIWSRDRAQAFA